MRYAIVGSGISGLTVAHRLHGRHGQHEFTLYEAGDHVGGHTHTHDVHVGGRGFAVDTGFIVFNERTYPNFIALLDELGVASRPTEMSFSVRCAASGLEYNGHDLNSLFAQRRNLVSPRFWRMLAAILRFNREAPLVLADGTDARLTLGQYLQRERYPREFIDWYIVPMAAAIWSARPEVMTEIPVLTFVRFFRNHGLLEVRNRPQWRTVCGGSREYVRRLTAPFAGSIRLHTPVTGVRRHAGGVQVLTRAAEPERYDGIIFACHADEALAILGPEATPAERAVLGAIHYQPNEAVLHTDATLLPHCARARASWNYHLDGQPRTRVPVTYDMARLQGLDCPLPLLVTLNRSERIDPAKVLRRIGYRHPVFTPEAILAQQRRAEISDRLRSWYCGAYWGYGFHEDGVVSALAVLDELDRHQAVAA